MFFLRNVSFFQIIILYGETEINRKEINAIQSGKHSTISNEHHLEKNLLSTGKTKLFCVEQ